MIDFELIFRILVFPGFTFLFLLTLFCDWMERKIEARIQNRVGPMVAGPAGILQPLADFIKLLTKEDIENSRKFYSKDLLKNTVSQEILHARSTG